MIRKTMKSHFSLASLKKNGPITLSKGSRIARNGSSNALVPIRKKTRSITFLDAKSEVLPGKLVIDLAIKTKSEANCFEHWTIKHKRHRAQQRFIAFALKPLLHHIKLPCRVNLTRYAPNELDEFDNLPSSFKYIVDAICAIITGNYVAGKADSDKRIKISCDQVKSKEYGIRIEITYNEGK